MVAHGITRPITTLRHITSTASLHEAVLGSGGGGAIVAVAPAVTTVTAAAVVTRPALLTPAPGVVVGADVEAQRAGVRVEWQGVVAMRQLGV